MRSPVGKTYAEIKAAMEAHRESLIAVSSKTKTVPFEVPNTSQWYDLYWIEDHSTAEDLTGVRPWIAAPVHKVSRFLRVLLSQQVPGAILLPGKYQMTLTEGPDDQVLAHVRVRYYCRPSVEHEVPRSELAPKGQ